MALPLPLSSSPVPQPQPTDTLDVDLEEVQTVTDIQDHSTAQSGTILDHAISDLLTYRNTETDLRRNAQSRADAADDSATITFADQYSHNMEELANAFTHLFEDANELDALLQPLTESIDAAEEETQVKTRIKLRDLVAETAKLPGMAHELQQMGIIDPGFDRSDVLRLQQSRDKALLVGMHWRSKYEQIHAEMAEQTRMQQGLVSATTVHALKTTIAGTLGMAFGLQQPDASKLITVFQNASMASVPVDPSFPTCLKRFFKIVESPILTVSKSAPMLVLELACRLAVPVSITQSDIDQIATAMSNGPIADIASSASMLIVVLENYVARDNPFDTDEAIAVMRGIALFYVLTRPDSQCMNLAEQILGQAKVLADTAIQASTIAKAWTCFLEQLFTPHSLGSSMSEIIIQIASQRKGTMPWSIGQQAIAENDVLYILSFNQVLKYPASHYIIKPGTYGKTFIITMHDNVRQEEKLIKYSAKNYSLLVTHFYEVIKRCATPKMLAIFNDPRFKFDGTLKVDFGE